MLSPLFVHLTTILQLHILIITTTATVICYSCWYHFHSSAACPVLLLLLLNEGVLPGVHRPDPWPPNGSREQALLHFRPALPGSSGCRHDKDVCRQQWNHGENSNLHQWQWKYHVWCWCGEAKIIRNSKHNMVKWIYYLSIYILYILGCSVVCLFLRNWNKTGALSIVSAVLCIMNVTAWQFVWI